jgi:hypothetical protein
VLVASTARRREAGPAADPEHRRLGGTHGARFAYLQVVATNFAALPLYAELGFETVYSYAYRCAIVAVGRNK